MHHPELRLPWPGTGAASRREVEGREPILRIAAVPAIVASAMAIAGCSRPAQVSQPAQELAPADEPAQAVTVIDGKLPFSMKVLTTGLASPWEITWGPDNQLWATERTSGRITRVNPLDGSKALAIQLQDVSAPGGQDGLLGLALHPDLLKGQGHDHVFAAYTYVDKVRGPDPDVTDPASPYRLLYMRIVRLTWDPGTRSLRDPVDVVSGLPASGDHNGGRLTIGPDNKLYFTIGDNGNGQQGNMCLAIQAQTLPTTSEIAAGNWLHYQGKSLRLNLDGSIPADNPLINGVRSHVFTYGHRNSQGLDFAPDGRLYASEQGPKSDDEINILAAGGNYGWPHVVGYRDNMAYQYARWKDASTPCSTLKFSDLNIDASVPRTDETSFTSPIAEPLATLFTVPNGWNFTDDKCRGVHFVCWPTIAASSIETYMPASGGIPGWTNSVLVTSLKTGSLYRVPLTRSGKAVGGPVERYFHSDNRYRDTALSHDSRTIYVATDSSGLTQATAGGVTSTLRNPGAILAFTLEENPSAAQRDSATSQALPNATALPAPIRNGKPPAFTAAQARRGLAAYNSHCVTCHGQDLKSTTHGTPLGGAYFDGKWRGHSVGELYRYSRDRMPPSRPATLDASTYADILAFMLQSNGITTGSTELPTDTGILDAMVIPALR